VPGDQLLQNLPRAEMQQGYVVVAVCSAHFFKRANKRLYEEAIFSLYFSAACSPVFFVEGLRG